MSTTAPARDTEIEVLEAVQRRVLWLATSIVHHANRVRKTPSGVKVGGHQASSASMASIMTALYFHHLRAPDRVSVKPHAAPVLHAIEYLLGRLDRRHLTELRAFGGLQSYPSRLKDPYPADFSTGSVGIGATAPIWAALAHPYVAGHFEAPRGGGPGPPPRPTSRPAGSAWARRPRSGPRSPIATSPDTSRPRVAGARSRSSATPSSTRARCGRRSSTRSCRTSARSCGSSTSTASRSTAWCPTSPPAGSRRCSRPPAGMCSP